MCKVALLSIHPQHSKNIFNGQKIVELRRTRPKLRCGDLILIYASSPQKEVVGIAEVEKVVEKSIAYLWEDVEDKACISHKQFSMYFSGTSVGYGIFLKKTFTFRKSISLENLKKEWVNFHPPQSYKYLSQEEVSVFQKLSEFNISNLFQAEQKSIL